MKTRLLAAAHFAAALLSAIMLTFVLSIATSMIRPVLAAPVTTHEQVTSGGGTGSGSQANTAILRRSVIGPVFAG